MKSWTRRRNPAARVPRIWPVSGLTKRRFAFPRGGPCGPFAQWRHACIACFEAACIGLAADALVVPLRVQFRLAKPSAGWLPDSRLTACRTYAHASTRVRASVGAGRARVNQRVRRRVHRARRAAGLATASREARCALRFYPWRGAARARRPESVCYRCAHPERNRMHAQVHPESARRAMRPASRMPRPRNRALT